MYYQFSIDVMSINLAVFCTSMKLADRYINAKLEGKYKGNVYVYVYISSCVCTYVNVHVHISAWKIEIENLTSIYPLRKLKLKKLYILLRMDVRDRFGLIFLSMCRTCVLRKMK